MKLNRKLNIIYGIIFVIMFALGASETGYSNVGYNIPGFILMLLGGLGLLSQAILLNIALAQKENKNT